MSICFFTIVARNYLSLALTLADSVRAQHPESAIHIFVADGLAGLQLESNTHTLIDLGSVLEPSFEEQRFQYNVTEYCTCVKPRLFQRMFDSTDAEYVYYLDPDTCLYQRIDSVHRDAPDASVFLTPHLLHCQTAQNHSYPEYKHLWEGIFNLGFCAMRRSEISGQFLAWWDQRLRHHCYADPFDGLHSDQKWMDYAPVYLGDALHIVRKQGVNVAHWNMSERTVSRMADGSFAVNGEPLILFHFSGFDFSRNRLTRHSPEEMQQAYFNPSLELLATTYRKAVHGNGYQHFIALPYAHNFYDNGQQITPLHRRLHRSMGGAAFDASPFSHKGRFYTGLKRLRLLDNSTAALQAHAAGSLPSLGRMTRVAHFMLRLFLAVLGAKYYSFLLKFFMKYARPENHRFLLESKSHRTKTDF